MTYRPSVIRSIQRGVIALSGTSASATIAAVTLARAVLVPLGASQTENQYRGRVRLALTDATTVTAHRAADVGGTTVVGFEVIEFYPRVLRSVQRGVITLSGAASNTATISSVTTSKAQVIPLGATIDIAGSGDEHTPRLALTDATTVTATKASSAAGTVVAGYQVVEFR